MTFFDDVIKTQQYLPQIFAGVQFFHGDVLVIGRVYITPSGAL